ncbi:MAG: isocitrate lyase/PEP mutase family protein [Providencia sp.]|uniref:isocitrate lyase/PEP mutase family protein n=1 Tax=Providencia sp. TaxID=589 RepID=UPI003F95FAB3
MNFNELHHQKKPLLIANVWDATSAIIAQQSGYQALGTSSAAIAAMLGYDDGEMMSFDELLYIVKRIKTVSHLPLSVDLEAGFGESADKIVENLKQLSCLGVVGVNLEDSKIVNGVRQLTDATVFANKLKQVRLKLNLEGHPLFFNIRTDTFLLNHEQALQETLYRGQLYAKSGADSLFVPCITQSNDIKTITNEVALPLNVMCVPNLPDFEQLKSLGVSRISMGNFIHATVHSQLKTLMLTIMSQQSFNEVFSHESH